MTKGWFGVRSTEYRKKQSQKMRGRKITWGNKISKALLNNNLLSNQAREMSSVEAAYVGAMLDGEGTVSIRKRSASFSIGNSELELISAFLRATGCGGIYYSPVKEGANLPGWAWAVGSRLTLESLAIQLAAYSIKAQKYIAWRCTNGL